MTKYFTAEEKVNAHEESKRKAREYYHANKIAIAAQSKEKYHNDPEFRQKKLDANHKKYQDLVFRKRKNELAKEKRDDIKEILLKFHAQSL